jgi:hypothetical protein
LADPGKFASIVRANGCVGSSLIVWSPLLVAGARLARDSTRERSLAVAHHRPEAVSSKFRCLPGDGHPICSPTKSGRELVD